MYHSVIILILHVIVGHFIVGCSSKRNTGVPSLMEESQEQNELLWLPYRPLSMDEYKSQSQIIYGTADWCLTCVLFEREVLMLSSIQKSLQDDGFVAFRADLTQNDPDVHALMQQHNVTLVPFLVIVKEGKTVLLKDKITKEELQKAILN